MEHNIEFKSTTYRTITIDTEELAEFREVEESEIDVITEAIDQLHEDPDVSGSWAENAEVVETTEERALIIADKLTSMTYDILTLTDGLICQERAETIAEACAIIAGIIPKP
jgi:hypothetical protein